MPAILWTLALPLRFIAYVATNILPIRADGTERWEN